jgi:RNA polymerase sigma factor (sigma-70 family)
MSKPDDSPRCMLESENDISAFSADTVSRLFREHNRALVGYLRARLRCENEAKEVAQEAYVRLLQLHQPGTPSLLRAYLFKTATNLAIDRLRRRAVRDRAQNIEIFDEVMPPRNTAQSPEQQLLTQEVTGLLLKSLQELPDKCLLVFRLHRLDGIDQREVARQLGFSARMVRRYVTYAMTYCRLRMDGVPTDQARRLVTL